MKKNTKRWNSN